MAAPPLLAAALLKPLPTAAGAPAVAASSLWANSPLLLLAVRRPGCQLCRAGASSLLQLKPQLDALGVRLAAVLVEDLPAQVDEFRAHHWPGDLYLDDSAAVYRTLGDGELRRGTLLGFAASLANPFSATWRNVRSAKGVEGNFEGDGMTFGGVLVLRKGGAVEYAFQEKVWGDSPPNEEVLKAVQAAVAASK